MPQKKQVKAYVKKKNISQNKIIENLLSKYNNIDVTKTIKFSDLPLSRNTLKGLAKCKYIEMTDIQRQSIGLALQGNDILGAAKTGSGKTLAFLIPVLEVLYCKQWTNLDGLGALIITPTRELAYQIYETLLKIGLYHDISAGLIIGGKDLKFEKKRMDQCSIVICTPGRLLQHMDENPLFNCVNMQILILDEADRCLDMGFEKTMNSIIENLPLKRQTLLFSATQTKSVKDLARLSLKDPLYVSVHEHSTYTTPENLQQSYIVCDLEDKIAMLWSFIRNHTKQKIIVFFSSCKQVKYIYEAFCQLRPNISLLALYGTLHQLKRMSIYKSFCNKTSVVLFATDIAARGLDFPAINWVLQMDCPEDVNAYIHRAGRTARFKSGGESLLVLLPSEEAMIERLKQRKIPINMIQVNPDKLQSPRLENLLVKNDALKESAQRAFIAYVKSVFLMKDKEIFNVHTLNVNLYAKSLGLTTAPRIRFLQRMQKKIAANNSKIEEKINKVLTNLPDDSEQESNMDNSDTDDNISTINNEEMRKIKEENIAELQCDNSDDDNSDDRILTLDKNIDISKLVEKDDGKVLKKKLITKIGLAKKLKNQNIVFNKKIVFDEDEQKLIDSEKTTSESAWQCEDEMNFINFEMIEQTFRDNNKLDKEKYSEMLKKKRIEKKRKLKAARKMETDDEDKCLSDDENKSNDDESSEGPDISWLPDPDKIYGKQQDSNEKMSTNESETDERVSTNESETDEKSEEESTVPRSFKRKLEIQEEHKKIRKKKQKTLPISNMTDEELALQFLQKKI